MGCPGIKKVATGIAGICPLRFFGQRAGRAAHFYRAGGQNRARACPLNITKKYTVDDECTIGKCYVTNHGLIQYITSAKHE